MMSSGIAGICSVKTSFLTIPQEHLFVEQSGDYSQNGKTPIDNKRVDTRENVLA